MPQLDFIMFPTQVFWLLVTFVSLFFIMWRIVCPRISNTLEARQKRIDDNLERAANFKRDAETALLAYEASLADARAAATEIISMAKKELSDQIILSEQEISIKLKTMVAENERKIQNSMNDALGKVQAAAKEVTADTVELFLGELIEPHTISSAVNDLFKK